MKTTKIGSHTLQLFDGIDELPSDRFMEFNKFMLIDSGIGGDLEAVDERLSNLYRYIASDKKDLAKVEIENLRSSLFFVLEKINPKMMAYICLIYSIDSVEFTDISEDSIKATISRLNDAGASKGFFYKAVDAFKKKNQEEIEKFFPDHFEQGYSFQAYSDLAERTELVLSQIVDGISHESRINELDEQFMDMVKPKSFLGKKSAELEYIKQYESTCVMIQDNLHRNAKKMTVMEYYEALSYLKIKFKPRAKKKLA